MPELLLGLNVNVKHVMEIIAESAAMKGLIRDAMQVAKSHASVFISGESGTGKEVIAQLIHAHSLRSKKPFIKVNCAAIAQNLIESEFFGHERGAFTGALQRRLGRLECAHEGTLLLDEVTEIPTSLQAKLLRAIQEKEFERVGGNQLVRVDVRFVATSNRDMKQAIEEKLFREDLYYRLNVIPLAILPLRERKEDILPLANYFLELCSRENQLPLKTLSANAKETLLAYNWPGNVRELRNAMERALIMTGGSQIEEAHFHFDVETHGSLGLTLYEMERKHILETLASNKGRRGVTAEKLGISVRTLRNKLSEYQKGSSQLPLF